jgi:hypothetical protein
VLRLPSRQTFKAHLNANGFGLTSADGYPVEPTEFMFSTTK